MKTRNYRTELKALSLEQLEKQVEYLLDQSLDIATTGMKQKASTSFSTKYVYAKQLLEKRKAEDKLNINQPEHTQLETLSISKNANDKICIWSEIDLQGIKAKNLLAILYDIPHGDKAEASADRIVKTLNIHNELVQAIRTQSEIITNLIQSKRIVNLDESIAYYEQLLKRAQQK